MNPSGSLFGYYPGFTLDLGSGTYALDSVFVDGADEFEDLLGGTGQTLGIEDLATNCAKYSLSGTLRFDD